MRTKITFIAFLVCLFSVSLSAQVVWVGPAAGSWDVAANWSTSALPVAADDVSIPAGFTVTVSTNVGTINRLSVSGKLIIAASGTLIIDQTVYVAGVPMLSINGAEIDNNGTLTVKNSVATATNTLIQFADNADFDNKLTNTGILTLDNTIGNYASTTGRVISLAQVSPGRVSTFKMGGTINLNVKPACMFIDTDGSGQLTIEGTVTLGSVDNYLNLRFARILLGGTLTFAPTANVTLYSGFVSNNGVINLQSNNINLPGTSFTNNGTFTVHGGPATTGYGIYFNAPKVAGALNTLNNNGQMTFDGNFPQGAFNAGGNGGTTNTFNNSANSTLILSNIDPMVVVFKGANTLIVNNDGVIKISTAEHNLTNATFNGTGTIVYNYVAGINKLTNFNGKIYANGKDIIVNLESNSNAKMILSDLVGRTVNEAYLINEINTISTSNLKGIYIVRLLTKQGSFSQKISL